MVVIDDVPNLDDLSIDLGFPIDGFIADYCRFSDEWSHFRNFRSIFNFATRRAATKMDLTRPQESRLDKISLECILDSDQIWSDLLLANDGGKKKT